MASEEELKQNTLSSMLVAIRATPLAPKVDANQALFAVSNAWKNAYVGGTLDLAVLHGHLMSQKGVLPNEAAQVCLLLHKRQEKLGLKVKLPPLVDTLPPNFKQELLNTLPKNAGFTNAAAAPLRQPTATVNPNNSAARLPKVEDQPAAPPPAAAGGGRKVNPVVIGAGVLGLVAAGVLAMPAADTRQVASVNLALPPEAAGWRVGKEETSYFLFVPEKDWSRAPAEMEATAKKVMVTAAGQGGMRMMLCNEQDTGCRQPRLVVRKGGNVTWVTLREK